MKDRVEVGDVANVVLVTARTDEGVALFLPTDADGARSSWSILDLRQYHDPLRMA